MRINLFEAPPSQPEIDAARAEAEAAEKQFYRGATNKRLIAFACATALAPLLWLAFHDALSTIILPGAMCFTAVKVLTYDYYGESESDFNPVDSWEASEVVKTIEMDPRVDVYRLAVAKQGRPLTKLEARAFIAWKRHGFHGAAALAKMACPRELTEDEYDEDVWPEERPQGELALNR